MMQQGILHVHSTHSYDGKVTLSELKTLLKAQGLSFACMTEHTDYLSAEAAALFVAECRALSDASFVFVPGFEVPYGRAHVHHLGATEFQTPVAKDETEIHAWRSVSPLVVLAHPVRNQFMVDTPLLAALDGVEVWNQQYEGKVAPRPQSVGLLKKLREHKPLLATGGIDLHRVEHLGSPYTTLDIPELTEAAILAALKAGAFRFGTETLSLGATEGITLSVRVRCTSLLARGVISSGKIVNTSLARLGIKLPKRLVKAIRGRV
jgi:hypothetical protein